MIEKNLEAPPKGGYSDTRLRFFIFGFILLGLILTPALGAIASFSVILLFSIFTAIKIVDFQKNNALSILKYNQSMDRMYCNSRKAEYYDKRIKECSKLHKTQRVTKTAIKQKKSKKINHSNRTAGLKFGIFAN